MKKEKSKPKAKRKVKRMPTAKELQITTRLCSKANGDPYDFGEFVPASVAKKSHDEWYKRMYDRLLRNPKSYDVKALIFGRGKIEQFLSAFSNWRGLRLYCCDRVVEGKKYTDVFIVPIDEHGVDMVRLIDAKTNDQVLNTSTICPSYCSEGFMK
jgi:hypothetical protein